MFRNILLPVDGSHFSELAFPLAARAAKAAGATLHIVRVHVPGVGQGDGVAAWDYDDVIREKERDHLTALLERAEAFGVQATSDLLEGPVARGIERYINALEIDLVVMSTHGRSGLRRAVLGSVAEECVRLTHVPIVLLHPRSSDDEIQAPSELFHHILVPLDGSPESEAVLPVAADVAKLMGARLTLARVATAPFDIAATIGPEAVRDYLARARQQAEEYLDHLAGQMQDISVGVLAVAGERAADGILRCREALEADGIAMSTHGRSGWSRIAVGSVAEAVVHKSPVPVLMFRPPVRMEKPATDRTQEPAELIY